MSLVKEYIVFTETLSSLDRNQAQAVVSSLKGICQSDITRKTTLLIVGSFQSNLLEGDRPSKKSWQLRV